ncbi:MAG: hypothetical protein EOO00_07350 [Chitinophagaceae bacterium]|nr:MAG: hypothetical protein EOO00_07350 [Chitinophagaceae bacterium]
MHGYQLQERKPVFSISIIIIIIAGILLRTIQFFGRSSLWFDELTNARNIQSRSLTELATRSLDYNQVSPVGFLWTEKLATMFLGETDHAFRFFPWIFSIIAIFLFYAVARKFLKDIFLVIALLFFALAGSQIFYAGEGKQYSGDVCFCLFLVWAGIEVIDHRISTGRAVLLGIVGMLAITSSMPAVPLSVFILGLIGAEHIRQKLQSRTPAIVIIIFCWLLGTIAGYVYAMEVVSKTVQDVMEVYWSAGFAPTGKLVGLILWIPRVIVEELNFFLTAWMKFEYPAITAIAITLGIFSTAGIYFMLQRSVVPAIIVFAPLLIALILSITRILPFSGRIAIYATWPVLIGGLAGLQWLSGIQWIAGIPNRYLRPVYYRVFAILLIAPLVIILALAPAERPPFHQQPSQPVLHAMKQKMQPGDVIYVYYKARHAMAFYGPKEHIGPFVEGRYFDFTERYLREVDQFKGQPRVWFFFSQWTEKQPFPDAIKKYMGTVIGKAIDSIPDPYGGKQDLEAAAYLYDLRK